MIWFSFRKIVTFGNKSLKHTQTQTHFYEQRTISFSERQLLTEKKMNPKSNGLYIWTFWTFRYYGCSMEIVKTCSTRINCKWVTLWKTKHEKSNHVPAVYQMITYKFFFFICSFFCIQSKSLKAFLLFCQMKNVFKCAQSSQSYTCFVTNETSARSNVYYSIWTCCSFVIQNKGQGRIRVVTNPLKVTAGNFNVEFSLKKKRGTFRWTGLRMKSLEEVHDIVLPNLSIDN